MTYDQWVADVRRRYQEYLASRPNKMSATKATKNEGGYFYKAWCREIHKHPMPLPPNEVYCAWDDTKLPAFLEWVKANWPT